MPNLVLVDDHPIVISGLEAVFRSQPNYHIVQTCTSAAAALQLTPETGCDILIADLPLLGERHEVLRHLRVEMPDLRIIIFTETACPATCIAALEAGVDGFVLKDSSTDELAAAIDAVLAGQEFISPSLAPGVSAERQMDRQRRQALASVALSTRENDVAHELLNGASNREIATKLGISYKTVKFYMNQIMRKFDVRNRLEVVLELQLMKATATPKDAEGGRTGLHRTSLPAAPCPTDAPRPARSRQS